MNGDYFFDTNSIVYYLQGRGEWVDFIDNTEMASRSASFITRMELLSYPEIEQFEENGIRRFLADLAVVPLDDRIENLAISMRRTRRLKLPDAIIAASAVASNATLLTGDKRLSGLDWPNLRTMNPA